LLNTIRRNAAVRRAYAAKDAFFADQNEAHLDAAIDELGATVEMLSGSSSAAAELEYTLLAFHLGNLLLLRSQRTRSPADLDAAIGRLRDAADTALADNPLRLQLEVLGRDTRGVVPKGFDGPRRLCQTGLANALETRYARRFHGEDIDEAITLRQAALDATPHGHRDFRPYTSHLEHALRLRSVVTGIPVDLPERELSRAELGAEYRTYLPGSVAALRRFEDGQHREDLDLAIRLARRGLVAARAVDVAGYVAGVITFGRALTTRYAAAGDLSDLDTAIELWRAVADIVGKKSIEIGAEISRPMVLTTLAETCTTAFQHTGSIRFLEDAEKFAREAEESHPAEAPDHFRYQYNLGIALKMLANESESDTHYAESLRLLRAANDGCPSTDPKKPHYVSMLAGFVAERPEQGDLAEAVQLARAAVALAEPNHPELPTCLARLGTALAARFEHADGNADAGDLDEAARCLRTAADSTQGQVRHDHLSNLARCEVVRYDKFGNEPARRSAVDLLRTVAEWPAGRPTRRLDAAREWGYLEAVAGRWAEATAAYETAMQLLGQTAPGTLAARDQERVLAAGFGLASDAAASCLELGDPARAIELLEQGRGIMLGRAIDARSDLTQLLARNAGLAERFDRLRTVLDAMTTAPADPGRELFDRAMRLLPPDLAGAFEAGHDAPRPGGFGWRERLLAERDALLAEIRAIPGFERFLLAPEAAELVQAAADGPIVIVNITRFRSDAIILDPGFGGAGIDRVPLPGVTPESVQAAFDGDPDLAEDEQVREFLVWVWDNIARKVLDRLRLTGTEPPPRLWWCPTGPVAFVPLHAAGRHDQPGEAVLDRATSSYIPTVRTLIHARAQAAGRHADRGHVLIVSMPETPGEADLPGAASEAAALRDLAGYSAVALNGRDATHDSVLQALRQAHWAHFACHAVAEVGAPSASRLILHDHESHPLTVRDISAGLRSDSAGLALLSACESADSGGIAMADEAISLASTFQLAGFPHVIASLWPVPDAAALRVVRYFYAALAGDLDPGRAPAALHEAVRRYRTGRENHPLLWSPFIHSGM
jgi:tetratricopeptide (TPR) repeat protein